MAPVSNALLRPEDADRPDELHPLHAYVCQRCWLVQLPSTLPASAHFHDDYVYFSSYSTTWLEHARRYAGAMVERFRLDGASRVLELGSNDGYLLQYFVREGIPCLGIEPSANTAAAARQRGVESRVMFFNREGASQLAQEGWQADLLIGNNVLAHVPDLHDFVGGMPRVLRAEGVATLEFPHLLRLLAQNQFDTLYHEHYSYFSLVALLPVLEQAGLRVFEVDPLPTHGGSLRVYACLAAAPYPQDASVAQCLEEERSAGLTETATYSGFEARVREVKRGLLEFLFAARCSDKRIVAYGAAAKGITLLNASGIGPDLIDYVVDMNPAKQGRLLPGSRLPVQKPDTVFATRPDFLLILPWNIREEIMREMQGVRDWGCRFVLPIPSVSVL